jgi:hypothetical protein
MSHFEEFLLTPQENRSGFEARLQLQKWPERSSRNWVGIFLMGCASKLKTALAALLEASDYAADTNCDRWDFAVPIRGLRKLGLSEADLRWLVRKGYVEHAREVTVPGDDGREFRPTGNLTFTRRTCFVLTETGMANARAESERPAVATPPGDGRGIARKKGETAPKPTICWDAESRKLHVNGCLVKRFKWPALNQEIVLNAFQEEGWPERIDDPLPPQPGQDSKRRLSDTIKCLNRKQTNPLIHFHGDGTGEGVFWELVDPKPEANGDEGDE